MYVCLFFVFRRASCRQWSITLAVRGWDDEGFVCSSRERADLHFSVWGVAQALKASILTVNRSSSTPFGFTMK